MTPITIAEPSPGLPCTTAHPITGAALVLDHRTGDATIRPVLAVDFYEGRP